MTTRELPAQTPAGTLTVEQAQQILAGNPTQDELFAALFVLATEDELAYVAALSGAVEILEQQNPGQGITAEQVNAVVRSLQTPESAPTGPAASTTTTGPPPIPLEEEEGPQPIGVEPGFIAPKSGGITPPRYFAGDQDQFAYASTTRIRRVQKDLEAAGLLQPGGYTPGFWDQASSDALFEAMAYGNRAGGSWEAAVTELKSIPRQVDASAFTPFEKPVEVKLDPASIEQRVKAEYRGRVGREPTSAELAEFGGYLKTQAAAAYQAEVDAASEEFARRRAGEIGDVFGDEGFLGQVGAAFKAISGSDVPAVQDVDPAARLQQLLDQRLRPEQEFVEDQADRVRNANNVYASLRTMTGLVG